jgi:AcrR family transcriptional regulator
MARTAPRRSTLRDKLDQTTRDVIVDAAIEQLVELGAFDFSYYALARRAGMSVRTIYRHFPARTDLIDALSRRLNQVIAIDYSHDKDGILDITRKVFGVYEQHANAFVAQLEAGQGRVRSKGRSKRVVLMQSILAKDLPNLPPERLAAVAGLMICLFSPTIWRRLREDVGLDGTHGGELVAWAIDTMWKALASEDDKVRRARARA